MYSIKQQDFGQVVNYVLTATDSFKLLQTHCASKSKICAR